MYQFNTDLYLNSGPITHVGPTCFPDPVATLLVDPILFEVSDSLWSSIPHGFHMLLPDDITGWAFLLSCGCPGQSWEQLASQQLVHLLGQADRCEEADRSCAIAGVTSAHQSHRPNLGV